VSCGPKSGMKLGRQGNASRRTYEQDELKKFRHGLALLSPFHVEEQHRKLWERWSGASYSLG